MSTVHIWHAGCIAGKRNYEKSSCPYKKGTRAYAMWVNGWNDGQQQRIDEVLIASPSPITHIFHKEKTKK